MPATTNPAADLNVLATKLVLEIAGGGDHWAWDLVAARAIEHGVDANKLGARVRKMARRPGIRPYC